MIYSVYANALYKNEDMPCSVKRPFSSTHTNKLLPADCIDFQECYVKSVSESTNTLWDVPVSASHHQQPLWNLADLSSAASNICRQPHCSHSAENLWVTTDLHFSEPSFFHSSRPALKDSSEKWEDKVWEKGKSQGEMRTAKPGLSSRAF